MSCTRYHFLLSQNLDGRLSSSRRESLLDHLAVCSDCARLADEMRVAQDLALSLPRERVASGFHESLWERIQAGEGSPDATFHEPVPLMSRLRYVATGAAAAALFLVALNGFTPDADPTESPRTATVARADQPTDDARTATSTNANSNTNDDFDRVRSNARVALTANPINPTSVAQVAQQITIENVNYLQSRAEDIQHHLERSHTSALRATLAEPLRELRSSTQLMQWLSDEEFIDLPQATRQELRLCEEIFPLVDRAQDPESLRAALEQLQALNSENFSRRFSIVCCDTQPKFLARFRDQIIQTPDVTRVLRFVISVPTTFPSMPEQKDPLQGVWVCEPQTQTSPGLKPSNRR